MQIHDTRPSPARYPATAPAPGHNRARNPGVPLDPSWFEAVGVNTSAVERRAATLTTRRSVKKDFQAAWLVQALTCIDLTTLAGDDTPGRVRRLCAKARQPLSEDLLAALDLADAPPKVGAVCVYPTMVGPAVKALAGSGIPVASVATGFPAGLTPLPLRLAEIKYAVEEGADEIDIVITRAHVLNREWKALYDEVQAMREACGVAHLKAILATGDLKTLRNVYAASMVAMQAGADFIKTSTGKEDVNATLPVSLVMLRASARLRRAHRLRHRLQAGGRRAHRQGRAELADPDARGTGPRLDAQRSVPHRRQRAAHRHRAPARTFRDRPLFRELSPRDGLRPMNKIADLMTTMDYGPSPENDDAVRGWLASHSGGFGHFIGGRFTKPGELFDVFNPAKGETIARVSQGGPADVDAAVAAARKALPAWSALPGDERARHLYALARHVQKRERFLSVLETIDNGKPIRETRDIDMPLVARHFYHHAGWA